MEKRLRRSYRLEMMSDTAGVSDIVFGLFWLLGYQFSPRLADIMEESAHFRPLGEARFWRIDRSADYGPLNRYEWSGRY